MPAADADEDRPVPHRVCAAAASGTVLLPLNSSMIAIAIVGIASQFESPSVSWIITALYITTAVSAPMAGRLGVALGARRVYLGGQLFVAAGSIAGTCAPDVGWLIAAYVLLGAGISSQMPNAMTMVRIYATRYHAHPRTAITFIAVCGQSIAALGPTLGGLLVGLFGWQSILWVNLPVVLVSTVSVLRVDVGTDADDRVSGRAALRSLDWLGIASFLVTMTAVMLLMVSLRDTPAWWLMLVAAPSALTFWWWERRASDPFLDVRALIRNHALTATLGRTLLTYVCNYCVYFGIPQWLQYSRGMSAIAAGLTMLPVAGISVLATFVGSYVYRRFGARPTLIIGTAAYLVGGLLIALVEKTTAPVLVLLLVAAVLGIPSGFNNIANQNMVNATTSVHEIGTAMGMYQTVVFIGANFAVVTLQVAAGGEISDEGLHRVGWFIVACSAALVAHVLSSPHIKSVAARQEVS